MAAYDIECLNSDVDNGPLDVHMLTYGSTAMANRRGRPGTAFHERFPAWAGAEVI